MQSLAVLPEVIRARPNFGFLRTVWNGAHIRFAGWDLVQTLLVSIQVILGREAIDSVAAFHIAFERFFVAELVLAVNLRSANLVVRARARHTGNRNDCWISSGRSRILGWEDIDVAGP